MNIIQPTAAQNAAVAKQYSDGSHPFSAQSLQDHQVLDALKWFAQRDMEALVDDSCGGIIGYVNHHHANRIAALLNVSTLTHWNKKRNESI